MIYDTLVNIYDTFFDTATQFIIFSHLYQDGSYIYFGLIFFLIPIAFSASFYFLYLWNPYSKWWHWLIVLLICLITVFSVTVSVAFIEIFASNNNALNNALGDPELPHYQYASVLPYFFGILNALYGLIVFLLFSWIFKQYSKLHGHIPI